MYSSNESQYLFYFLHVVPEVLLLYGLRADPAPPDGLLLRLLQHLLVPVEGDSGRGLHLLHDGPLGGLVRNLHHVICTLRGRGAPQLAWVPTGARMDKILSRFECFRLIPSLRTTNLG